MAELPKKPPVDLKAEIAKTNDLLSQLHIEVKVLKQRRDDMRSQIDAESALLLSKREGDLRMIEHEHEARLKPLQAGYSTVVKDISAKEAALQGLESEHLGLTLQVEAERATLAQVQREVEQKKGEFEAFSNQSVGISAQITSLQSQVNPLREELAQLTADLHERKAYAQEVEADIVRKQNEFSTNTADLHLKIDQLEHKRRDLATDISQERMQMERAREELATWQQTIQKREKVVRAREFKVATQEQRIADNAQLLDL
jgi:chromosome segregation ATPase